MCDCTDHKDEIPAYDAQAIESKWMKAWEDSNLFAVDTDDSKPKKYVLEMFPYPSGDLHMGHARNYTIGDAMARQARMRGYDVLHPIGFDAFGLPAENAAIKHNTQAAAWTYKNMDQALATMKRMGFSYDLDRMVKTCSPDYYRWGQWIFEKLWEKGLVYRKKNPVNWCPTCKTVLANEQVTEGKCWRCGTEPEKRDLEQWYYKITEYSQELLDDLEKLPGWPERVKQMQANWIGRSEGAEVDFTLCDKDGEPIEGDEGKITVFTTRADTLFGVSFFVLAPEFARLHELVEGTEYEEAVTKIVEDSKHISAVERAQGTLEKHGAFTGRYVVNPVNGEKVPVWVADYVVADYGTGAVMAVPCGDQRDFEFARKYDLPIVPIILDDDDRAAVEASGETIDTFHAETVDWDCAHAAEGTLVQSGKYTGMRGGKHSEGEAAIVADLEAEGYLVKTEPYSHNVGTCYRCHNDVEPIISAQWFVKMKPLAEEAIRVVKEGETKFVPERFSKTYLNWMENVRDWCISRQLWWGHQIPAWTCADCGHITVSREDVCKCEKCGSTNIERDPDVLDTWFSSALWPFETLGWPEKTEDLDYFYPTDVLVTGYDIIFFWVARMIFSGCEHTGKTPFHTVLIHGLVRDNQGRKMSKSLGNGIDPLEMIDKYGCDALRMNLITGNSPGNDTRFYTEKCEAMRNFANKLWNASRYVLMNLGEDAKNELPALDKLEIADKWVLSKLNTLIAEVTENLEKYELGVAVQKVYDFIWDTYCDWYIELTKARLYSEDAIRKQTAISVLVYVLDQILRLLHPFMPFITEEIWQSIPHEGDALIAAKWPEYREELAFKAEESHMESVMDAIRAIRNRRAEMNVPPSRKAALYVLTSKPQVYAEGEGFIQRLAFADTVSMLDKEPENLSGMVTIPTADAKLYIPMGQLVDVAKELDRISKELEKNRKFLGSLEAKLSNEKFVSRAPEAVVNAEKEKAQKTRDLIASLEQSEAALKSL